MSNFRNLERLDLFHSSVDHGVLQLVLKNNPHLKHINLGIHLFWTYNLINNWAFIIFVGFFSQMTNMDEIAIQISKYNLEMVSIDMWKSFSLSAVGLMALSKCTQLEEVDFGWWYDFNYILSLVYTLNWIFFLNAVAYETRLRLGKALRRLYNNVPNWGNYVWPPYVA